MLKARKRPTQAIDLDGLEPVVEDGILIGYNVQKGQGPTQIRADIYNPAGLAVDEKIVLLVRAFCPTPLLFMPSD